MIKLSVIIPIYNTPRELLEHCLSSIKENISNMEGVEILCVNDGSTEPYIEEMLKETEKQDKRFIYISKPSNTGLSDTRNVGMGIAQGEYLVFIDADDYLEPDALQYMIDKIEETESDVVMFAISGDDNKEKKIEFKRLYTSADKEKLSNDLIARYKLWGTNGLILAAVWAKIYKREFLSRNKIIFVENIYAEDDFFTLELINAINAFYVDNKQVYHYVKNELSLTHAWNSQLYNQIVYELQLLNDFVAQHFPKDELMEEAIVQRAYYYIRVLKNRYFTHPQNTKSFWELKSEMNSFITDSVISNRIKKLGLFNAEGRNDFKNRLLLKFHLYWIFLITERNKRKRRND